LRYGKFRIPTAHARRRAPHFRRGQAALSLPRELSPVGPCLFSLREKITGDAPPSRIAEVCERCDLLEHPQCAVAEGRAGAGSDQEFLRWPSPPWANPARTYPNSSNPHKRCQTGLRFSRKARMPSFASCVFISTDKYTRSASLSCFEKSEKCSRARVLRVKRRTPGLNARSSSSSASTATGSSSSGTTHVTRPSRCASAALIGPPVRIRCAAACHPISLGNVTMATGGKQPSLISGRLHR